MKKIVVFCGALLLAAGVFIAAVDPDLKLGRSIEVMVNIMRDLRLYYVDEVDPDDLLAGAAAGLTRDLDPYTEWMPESEMDNFAMMTTGKYGGIGSLIRRSGDYVIVAAPYENSPAAKAGLIPGDKFVAIEGKRVVGSTSEQVTALLKGTPGTTFEARVLKLMTGKEEVVSITREQIRIPAVPYYAMLADGVGYIQHTDFSEGAGDQMRAAVEALKAQGMKSLILDYRNNGGGILQEAVQVLSLFVPKGTEVVSTRGRVERMNEVYKTADDPLDLDTPIVVLTNRNSASAAEIVSGALQDLDRAVLMGQKTFGKGLVQMTRPVGYGSYLKLTVSKYYIPSGRCIQTDSVGHDFKTAGGRPVRDGGGITPDIELEPTYIDMFSATVYARGYIEDFGDQWVKNGGGESVPYSEFEKFMADKEVDYTSETRYALDELKARAQREEYYDAIKTSVEEIEANLHDDKMSNLALYRDRLESMIERDLAMRKGHQRAATELRLRTDEEAIAARGLLADRARYDSILASR